MLDFEIITIFPDLIEAVAPYGVVGRAGVFAPSASSYAEARGVDGRHSAHDSGGAETTGALRGRPAASGEPEPSATSASGSLPVQAQGTPLAESGAVSPESPEPHVSGRGRAESGRPKPAPRYRLRCWNPRDFTFDNYRRVDDRPYGGGPGMVMLAEPLLRCLQAIREKRAEEGLPDLPVIHLSPQGRPLTQGRVRALAATPGAILLCGRYEAIDQRFLDACVDEEISMGDFVVSGGELPAMLLLDAVVRLLPGVLNHGESATQDSFESGLLDCPHYTRPEHLPGLPPHVAPGVPSVLMSGNHKEIERWRHARSLEATTLKRPDLLRTQAAQTPGPSKGGNR